MLGHSTSQALVQKQLRPIYAPGKAMPPGVPGTVIPKGEELPHCRL